LFSIALVSLFGILICLSLWKMKIYSYQYRIQHESIPLTEEKQILKEIRLLEGTRDKVIANAAMRAKIKESMGQKDDIQGQVKVRELWPDSCCYIVCRSWFHM